MLRAEIRRLIQSMCRVHLDVTMCFNVFFFFLNYNTIYNNLIIKFYSTIVGGTMCVCVWGGG